MPLKRTKEKITGNFVPSSINPEARTVDVTWSMGGQVLRRDPEYGLFYEEISLEPNHVRMSRLENGLEKLRVTAVAVAELKAQLAEQEIELTKKNEEADKLIEIVGELIVPFVTAQVIAPVITAKIVLSSRNRIITVRSRQRRGGRGWNLETG